MGTQPRGDNRLARDSSLRGSTLKYDSAQPSSHRVKTHTKVAGASDASYENCSASFLFFKQTIADPTSKTVCMVHSVG
jgi:hypothetical protein